MDMRRNKLVVDGLFRPVLAKFFGTFVIEHHELRFEAGLREVWKDGFVPLANGLGFSSKQGATEDVVAVIIVDDENILVATA